MLVVLQLVKAMRKGQGLPVNVIILILLGLIILVIVIALLTQRTTLFGKGLKNVSEQECKPPVGEKKPIGYEPCEIIYGSFTNVKPNEVCCRIKDSGK